MALEKKICTINESLTVRDARKLVQEAIRLDTAGKASFIDPYLENMVNRKIKEMSDKHNFRAGSFH